MSFSSIAQWESLPPRMLRSRVRVDQRRFGSAVRRRTKNDTGAKLHHKGSRASSSRTLLGIFPRFFSPFRVSHSRLASSRIFAPLAFFAPLASAPRLFAPRPLCASRLAPLAFAPLAFAPLAFAPRNSRLVVFPSRSPFFFCGNISLHLLWDRVRGPIHTRNPPSEDHALDLDQPSIEVYSGPCES